MSVKSNIIANYFGQGLTTVLSFIFIPYYIKYLGMESYGLIGLFALLQTTLSIFDSVINPLLNREMACYTGGARTLESTRDLLRTLEVIGFLGCSIFSILVFFNSDFLAQNWLNVENLPISQVSKAIMISGFVVSLRCLETLYKSAVTGLQKQVYTNIILVIGAIIRNAGVLLILKYVSPTIEAYFYWQGFSSILTLFSFVVCCYKSLPGMLSKAAFSTTELKNNWKFSISCLGSSFLNFCGSQSDKLLLSKFLTLSDFGHYSLAVSVTNVISIFMLPIAEACYPRINQLRSQNKHNDAANYFHQCNQMIAVVCGVATMSLFFYGDVILNFWTKNMELTITILPYVKVLSLSVFLYSLSVLPSLLPTTAGKPIVGVKIGIFRLIMILIVSTPLIMYYKGYGATYGNLIQNIILLLFFPVYFNYYLKSSQYYWFTKDLLLPCLSVYLTYVIVKLLTPVSNTSKTGIISVVFIAIIILFVVTYLQKDLRETIKKRFVNNKTSSGV